MREMSVIGGALLIASELLLTLVIADAFLCGLASAIAGSVARVSGTARSRWESGWRSAYAHEGAGMATPMSNEQRRAFLLDGTRTGVLATVRADGRPHAAPIWFTLDDDDVVFTTGAATVKGRNLRRAGRALLVVDESTPPFDFVIAEGSVQISEDLDEMLHWATILGGRYMGADQAADFGRRNAVPGELLIRLTPQKIVALAGIAE
jgi:hypothetical protein